MTYASSGNKDYEANNGSAKEHKDREGHISSWNMVKLITHVVVKVMGGDDPWKTKSKEDVDRVGTSDVTNC